MSHPDHTSDLVDLAKRVFVPNVAQRPLVQARGEGSRVWDVDGREYVDLGAGIAVNSLGHQDPELLGALIEQAHTLWHTSNTWYSEPAIRLAEDLVASADWVQRVFLCNSGTEANEAAIKLARKWSSRQFGPHKRTILTFTGSFHGRTLGAVTATAQPKYHEGFEPLPAGFRYLPFNDIEALRAAFDDSVCAVLLEPIQGEGGITPAAPGFLAELRALCDTHQALLMLDEIQCGMGRSGKLYCHAWDGIEPDVMSLAKALGCGFPVGALLVGEKAAQALQPGSHGTTFGGNPLAAAVARVALRRLSDPALLERVETLGRQVRARLTAFGEQHGVFREVRGRGLMIGAELTADFAGRAPDCMAAALAHGVLILQAGPNVLRFLPPLNISDADLDEGLARAEAGVLAALKG